MQGHADGEMWGLSTHPSKDIFVTTSDDMSVRTWDINTKVGKVIKFKGKSSQQVEVRILVRVTLICFCVLRMVKAEMDDEPCQTTKTKSVQWIQLTTFVR